MRNTGDAGTRAAGNVRLLLRMQARHGREQEFESVWSKAAEIISAVPGNIRQDLMHDPSTPREYLVMSEWSSREALEEFDRSHRCDQMTAALRNVRESSQRTVYDVLHTLPGQGPAVRVLVTTAVPAGEEERFEQSYRQVATQMRAVPGHIREELLHEPGTPTYHVLAEWASEAAFRAWVDDPLHIERSGPLVPYLERGFQRRIFTIAARPPEASGTPAESTSPAVATSTRSNLARRPNGSASTGVLVAGAGPTGLMLAIELTRRGVPFRLVEKNARPPSKADKAIGVHCRTMEIFEDLGVVDAAIDAGVWLDGQIVVVNGRQTHRVEWDVPDLPYAHLALPQYETERILTARLEELGGSVERGVELRRFTQDASGVTASLSAAAAAGGREQSVRAQYLVGCDGAHSVVRKGAGCQFGAGAGRFPQLFMLADLDVDWSLPPTYLLRFIHETDGTMDGMLVCVPLRGEGRYRIATMAPPRIMAEAGRTDVPPGFMKEHEPPTLAEFQEALDQLAPAGTTGRNLRWSSIFQISHGLVDRYRAGRVFVAGDAAHLHPPAGGQGMNTGIQDAYNLGWKLALAVAGRDAPGLLDTYEAERRPAAKSIVDRAVRVAFTDQMDQDDERRQFLEEMQITLTYHGTPGVGEALGWDAPDTGPAAGDRAPDVRGLTRRGVGHPSRLFDLIRGTAHTLLLYADATTTEEDLRGYEKMAGAIREQAPGLVNVYLVQAPGAAGQPGAGVNNPAAGLPVFSDTENSYRATYASTGHCAYLIRPDGHVGFRTRPVLAGAIEDHLRKVFAG